MAEQNLTKDIATSYIGDKARRKRLADMLDKVIQWQKGLDMATYASDTEQLRELVSNETFKVLIIGEFNTGKSTFINALLRHEILPTKAIPATAVINELRYGEKPGARLHFKDEEKEPLEIKIEQLNDYVLIKNTDYEEKAQEEIRESPFSHVEIWWPLELCRDNNVELIDSPGLNEDRVREDLTYSYLKKVDAVLFLMAAVRFGPAQTEMDTVTMLDKAGHHDLFFVVNQWDLLRPRQREEVEEKALRVLKKLTNRKDDIYFVSAMDALEGQMSNDPEMIKSSGFTELEASLHSFLAEERGRMKSKRSAQELRRTIRKMEEEAIPQKINLLKMPLNELQEKYEKVKEDLNRLQADKASMLEFVGRQRTQITNLTKGRIKEFFHSINYSVNGWAEEFPIEIRIHKVKHDVEKAIDGLANHLSKKLEDAFTNWEKENLAPFIKDRMTSFYRELEIRAKDFEDQLNDAHFTLNGTDLKVNVEDEFGPQSPLERILAAAGGWFVGGIGSGAIGAFLGWKEMLKSIIPNVGAIIAAIIIGLPLIPIILIASTIVGVVAIEKMGAKIRKTVAEEFKRTLREKSSEQATKIASQLDEQLRELKNTLEAGMERQIAELQEQAESALDNHRQGEREVESKLEAIDEIKKGLTEMNIKLDEFINDLAK